MGVLSRQNPKDVFSFFEKICSIPHGSGNTKAIADYCVKFAEEHGFEWYRDDTNNIMIRKPASAGYEKADTIILQGHLDMVSTLKKTPSCLLSTVILFVPTARLSVVITA